ncbi:hypothetical protein AVEN_157428-1, partial [Araneus ventricosus]
PRKPGLFGRKRHELESPNLGSHFPHHPNLYYKMDGNGLWLAKIIGSLYRAYLLSDLRTSPHLKRSQPPQTGLRRC